MNVKEKEFLKKLGKKVRALRHNKGWSLEQTEEFGKLAWRHLQRIESGKNVTMLTMLKISRLYGVSFSDMLKDL